MSEKIYMPDPGTAEAVEIVEVLIAVGDTVAREQGMYTIETDKAVMDVPAPSTGVIDEVVFNVGDTVKQGDHIATFSKTTARAQQAAAEPATVAPAATIPPATIPAATVAPAATTPASATHAPAITNTPLAIEQTNSQIGSGAVYAGPAVRKLARKMGVDLSHVAGSAGKGRVVKDDVYDFVNNKINHAAVTPSGSTNGADAPLDFSAFGEYSESKMSKMQRLTAQQMCKVNALVPSVTQFDLADISSLDALRQQAKAHALGRGIKLTVVPFLIKVTALALREFPQFNVSIAGNTIYHKQYIHVGMAVDTPNGLLVPVIQDAVNKSIYQIAREVYTLADVAKNRTIKPEQMRGGCISISSLGALGGTGFTPIINHPEVAIVGVSRAQMQPRYINNEFVPRLMLPLSLTYDHRAVNGGDAGRFLTWITEQLASIQGLLLE